jgi:hypothetical protein
MIVLTWYLIKKGDEKRKLEEDSQAGLSDEMKC